jgi:hypothetical protein
MSLLDTLTGGKSDEASDAYKRAEQAIAGIQTPTIAQLTLPELQKYVQAGIMTPAEAQAAFQKSNAYDTLKVDPSTMQAEQRALEELNQVGEKGGMTDSMKAQLSSALDQVQTQEQGANAGILDQMAQRGIPTSLMATAAQMANNANQSRNANLGATQAAGQAEQEAISAMLNEGSLASQMHGQQYQEAANKAAAANAMQQWNAQATNTANLTNAGFQQQANAYNTQNKQDVSNQNTGLANYRTGYNANVPQTVFQDALSKATGQAGAAQQYGNLTQQQGNQTAGINLGAINFANTAIGGMINPAGQISKQQVQGPQFPGQGVGYAEGGKVPGHAEVPGDSPRNDKVPALLSAGEIVVPRSIAPHPEAVKNFVTHLIKNPVKPVHHEDVKSVLDALTARRG